MRWERSERHKCRGEHLRYYIVPNFYEFCNRFFEKNEKSLTIFDMLSRPDFVLFADRFFSKTY